MPRLKRGLGRVQRLDDLAAMRQIFTTGIGWMQGAGGALDQAHAQGVLKFADLAAQGGNGNAHPARRFREAAVLQHTGEQGHRVEIGCVFHLLNYGIRFCIFVYCLIFGMMKD